MRFEGRRVYVTGATGFIGGAVTARLLQEGARVTCLVRPQTSAAALERLGAQIVRGDIRRPETLDASGHDLLIHAAAWVGFGIPPKKRALFEATNVEGTRNVMEAARKADVGKVVHVSSVAVLGASGHEPVKEDTQRPASYRTAYERTKTEAHDLALAAGLPIVLPMPGIVLGPGGPLEPVTRAVARGRLPALPSDDAPKGWVHIVDTVDGIVACALKGKGSYLLVDENARLTEILVAALEEAGLRIPRARVPIRPFIAGAWVLERAYHLVHKTPPVSRELVRSLRIPMAYDASRARRELAWQPDLVRRLAADLIRG